MRCSFHCKSPCCGSECGSKRKTALGKSQRRYCYPDPHRKNIVGQPIKSQNYKCRKTAISGGFSRFLVRDGRLELPTSCSQSRRATNCANPGYLVFRLFRRCSQSNYAGGNDKTQKGPDRNPALSILQICPAKSRETPLNPLQPYGIPLCRPEPSQKRTRKSP